MGGSCDPFFHSFIRCLTSNIVHIPLHIPPLLVVTTPAYLGPGTGTVLPGQSSIASLHRLQDFRLEGICPVMGLDAQGSGERPR